MCEAGYPVRQQSFGLSDNLGDFFCGFALPQNVELWTLTTPSETLVEIGAPVVTLARYRQ